MATWAGAVAVWLVLVPGGGWTGAQDAEVAEVAEPEKMSLEELLRLQQVVNEALRGGGEKPAAAPPEPQAERPPLSGLEDLFPPVADEPETESAVVGSGVPEPDAIVEAVGADWFLAPRPPAPVAGEGAEPPVARPAAEVDDPAGEPEGAAAAGAEPPGGDAETAGQGLEERRPGDAGAGGAADEPAAAAAPVMPPDGTGLRLGRAGHPVVLRPPSEAYLRRMPRGALGYRAPLVVKQRVGPMVVGGVYIPAHDAWVVLREGHWQLVGDPAPAPPPSSIVVREAAEADVEPTRREPVRRNGFWSRLLGPIGAAPGEGE